METLLPVVAAAMSMIVIICAGILIMIFVDPTWLDED